MFISITFFCYIIFSPKVDKYYIGYTSNLNKRIEYHNTYENPNSFTSQANDWQYFLTIKCFSKKQAIEIEDHIKKMKSRKYIENLKQYPEMIEKLVTKYSP